jgi:hypothetical protein
LFSLFLFWFVVSLDYCLFLGLCLRVILPRLLTISFSENDQHLQHFKI